MKGYLHVQLPKLYMQLQITSAIVIRSLYLDMVVDSQPSVGPALVCWSHFPNSGWSDFGSGLEENSHKNMLIREKYCYSTYWHMFLLHLNFFSLVDHQILILGKILWIVNFGLCRESAVVEKKLCKHSSSVCTPFGALISISPENWIFSEETVHHTEILRKTDCLAHWLTSSIPCFCVYGAVCIHMSSTTLHITDISPLRSQPAASGISFSTNRSQMWQWYFSFR